jgi:hypothetical protein
MASDGIPVHDGVLGCRLTRLDVTGPAGVIAYSARTVRRPERAFLMALLEDAIICYRKYACSGTRRGRRIFREAEAWLMEPEADAPISFRQVCDLLRVDPDSMRRHLGTWRSEAATLPSGNPTTLSR